MHKMHVYVCQCRGECCNLGSFKNNYIYLDFYKFYISARWVFVFVEVFYYLRVFFCSGNWGIGCWCWIVLEVWVWVYNEVRMPLGSV